MRENDEKKMKIAIKLAKRGDGKVSPNPMVGTVITRNGNIIATGYHTKAGKEHAEIESLKKIDFDAKNCTLYINLEPCCHTEKKTPPCVDAIIKSGIKRVVVAMIDPNPAVNGRGVQYLRQNGIEVDVGCMEKEAQELNRAFKKFIVEKIPYIILKIAMTIDGKIADRDGNSRWITGEEARKNVHRTRNIADAILVGIGTVEKDDPYLLPYLIKGKKVPPLRIVLDTSLKISEKAKIINTSQKGKVLIAAGRDKQIGKIGHLMEKKGINIHFFKQTGSNIDLFSLLNYLGGEKIMTLLVEGGKRVWTSFIKEDMFDEIHLYIAPKILSDSEALFFIDDIGIRKIEDMKGLKTGKIKKFGEDIFIQFFKDNKDVYRNY